MKHRPNASCSVIYCSATVRSGAHSCEVQVHVSAETLTDFDTEGCCHSHDGPNLAPHTMRRLSCDAGIVRIVEDGKGQPLDVGRKTRTISPALKRALSTRDQGCRFPGCGATPHLHGHHIKHWADGGSTSLDNLVPLHRSFDSFSGSRSSSCTARELRTGGPIRTSATQQMSAPGPARDAMFTASGDFNTCDTGVSAETLVATTAAKVL